MTGAQISKCNYQHLCIKALICIFLSAAILLVYWQVTTSDFIIYDDPSYITENQSIQQGIHIESIKWAINSMGYAGNWHPITWISHMLDIQLFGLNPGMHHLTNVIFHIMNTFLLFIVLDRMTGSLWKSAAVAALFALHPLHVESVAWISERKDVLSSFFLMLTLIGYSWYTEKQTISRYSIVILFYILGLLSKPMLVTLPFLLLLLDFWPLERMKFLLPGSHRPSSFNKNPRKNRMQGLILLILEKIPLLFFSIISCIITYLAQRSGAAVNSLANLPISTRLANAVVSYKTYLEQIFWPYDLAVFYPYPDIIDSLDIGFSSGLLLFVTVIVLFHVKRLPYLLVGWFWYIGTFVPVIGIVQVGSQCRADRYTYIPLIGIFIILIWGIVDILDHLKLGKTVGWAIALVFPLCMWVSWVQVGFWKNSQTLFKQTLAVTSNNYIIHNNLGTYLLRQRNFKEAIQEYKKALEIKPDLIEAHNNLGTIFLLTGYQDEAISHLLASARIVPHQTEVFNNLGVAYSHKGDYFKAIEYFRSAIQENPSNINARKNLEEARAKYKINFKFNTKL